MARNATIMWGVMFLALPAHADEKQAFRRDLQFLFDEIQSGYVALSNKRDSGLELDTLRGNSFAELGNVKTTTDFHRLLQRITAQFGDSHFYTHVAEERVSYLGFESDFAQGHVVVTSVAKELPASTSLQVGDRIVSFNGRPVADELSIISAYIGKSSRAAVQRYAAMMLGRRYGNVLPLEKGVAQVVVKRSGEPDMETELAWEIRTSDQIPHPYHDKWHSPIAVPNGAVELDAPSTAYIARTPNQTRVGFLRIPNFMVDGHTYRQQLESYGKALDELQMKSDVLILDITFNDGGNVEYGAAILALFMDDEFPSYCYRFLATAAELEVWEGIAANEAISAAERDQLGRVSAEIRGAMQKRERLTEPLAFVGPNQAGRGRYSKPIVLLTNEFTASAADIFAVYLQVLGRATLVGQSAMGAGSKARQLTLPASGIRIRMPRVLFCRPNGRAIEGAGASPDRRYDIQVPDLIDKYPGLRQFAFRTAETLIDDAP